MPGSKQLLNIKFFNSRLAFARGANNRGHVIEVFLERAAPGVLELARVHAEVAVGCARTAHSS